MPSTFNLTDHVQWLETAATKLLENLLFLCDGFNKNEAVIQFYYTSTYQIVDKCPESFSISVPLPCLALVAAMLSQWADEGWAALQEVEMNVERYQHIQAVLD
ncbi:hypothetical protein BKA82DRAFT_4015849 [Pisolithus tinctorius]|nr:hypothetical protein BKA82DRAFT_4015849 [Pisolithus tinctorius]